MITRKREDWQCLSLERHRPLYKNVCIKSTEISIQSTQIPFLSSGYNWDDTDANWDSYSVYWVIFLECRVLHDQEIIYIYTQTRTCSIWLTSNSCNLLTWLVLFFGERVWLGARWTRGRTVRLPTSHNGKSSYCFHGLYSSTAIRI